MTMTTKTLFAAAIAGLAITSAQAGTIFSEDFEGWDGTTDANSGGAAGIFTGTTWGNLQSPNSPGTWDVVGVTNLLRPSASSGWLSPVPAELGTTFAVNLPTSATADLADTFAANTDYTLTFTHFRRDDQGGAGVIAKILTTGGTELASETFASVDTTDTYVTRTVTYSTTNGAEVGQNIRIQLLKNGGRQGAIDNIVLDAVPEPGSLALLGLGGLLVARRRRG